MLNPTSAIDRSSLHPGTGYLIAPRVPHGLAAVVEGLTREVLRHHPEDIYVFAAHHFEKLLKLREQYHAEEYSHEFSHGFNREFNLWPTKNSEIRNVEKSSNGDWSLEKEIEIERHKKLAVPEENPEDISTDRKYRKETSKQAYSKGSTKRNPRRPKDKDTVSDTRATKIISQMPSLHGPSKNVQTKDIKQELRKNKLSGEKGKTVNDTDKAIRGERRSRMRIYKLDKRPEEEVGYSTMTTMTTMTTSTASRTSTRRPLKKVRRIETESETETERETKGRFENRYDDLL